VGFLGADDAEFCSDACVDEFGQQRLKRYRCFRCNKTPVLFKWVRVSPTAEAPLCGTDECVIAWRPQRGWPDVTTRPLRRERHYDPLFVLTPPPRSDALTGEVLTLARNGRFKADETMHDVVRCAINLIIETATEGVPSNPWRQVPVFRVLDLTRALRHLLGDIKEGSFEHHLLTCLLCSGAIKMKNHRLCNTGYRLQAAERDAAAATG